MEKTLGSFLFDHDFVNQLPGDPEPENFGRQVTGAFYSLVNPTPTRAPKLAGWADDLAKIFGLARPIEGTPEGKAAIELLSGNRLSPGMRPYAAVYGGHQFGHWAGQLGDGRAITLGEITDLNGQAWELQLKGAGPTPYSRRADGRAVLRSSIREFLCSEAMFHLGIPTTRALSVIETGDPVVRDMFYDGHPAPEPGAIVARLSPSFLRFGNFEIFAARHDLENLRRLVDYTLDRLYPGLRRKDEAPALTLFREVCQRSVQMCVDWMRVGFVHGVMNTDNMSILGLTIDYGPYGWLDNYDPSWTPNTTDLPGRRYCYGRQPGVLMWNLIRLAGALVELDEGLGAKFETTIHEAEDSYGLLFLQMTANKLGLSQINPETDITFLEELGSLMLETEVDMTLFYRGLADFSAAEKLQTLPQFLTETSYNPALFDENKTQRWTQWLSEFQSKIHSEALDPKTRREQMNRTNPLYVPRNYLAQECIDAATAGDSTKLQTFMEILKRPYEEQSGAAHYAKKRPEWAKTKAGCSALSCSS